MTDDQLIYSHFWMLSPSTPHSCNGVNLALEKLPGILVMAPLILQIETMTFVAQNKGGSYSCILTTYQVNSDIWWLNPSRMKQQEKKRGWDEQEKINRMVPGHRVLYKQAGITKLQIQIGRTKDYKQTPEQEHKERAEGVPVTRRKKTRRPGA